MANHQTLEQAKKEIFTLADRLGVTALPYETLNLHTAEIRRAAMRLGSLGERQCNGVIGPDGHAKWDDKDQETCDRWTATAERRAATALRFLFCDAFKRLEIEFQGDPRGPSIIIHERYGRQRLATFW